MKSSNTHSLIRSKEMLQKITNQVDSFDCNRQNSIMLQSIQASSKQVQLNLDGVIEDNFRHLLHSPTLMPLDTRPDPPRDKENTLPHHTTTALEGAKALMYHYWEKNKKNCKEGARRCLDKTDSAKGIATRKSDGKLPSLAHNEFKISTFIRAKERVQELGIVIPKEVREDCQVTIKVQDYRAQTEDMSFFKFQKVHFKQWEEVQSIIVALEKFAELYELPVLLVPSKNIFALIDRVRKGIRMNPHDLLGCCENAEAISEENSSQAGIRFFGRSGTIRAIVRLQAQARMWVQRGRFKARMREWSACQKIQSFRRRMLFQRAFKARILARQEMKLQYFNGLQKDFRENFRLNELKSRLRYEIHIPSHSYNEFQKLSIDKYLERQNTELCRIFRIAQKDSPADLRVIYVSPVHLSKDILKYYRKMLQLASEEELEHKLIILTPGSTEQLPVNLSLSQMLYYSPKTIAKIRSIVGDSYAYIVPSMPSSDYINLCHELRVPLYSSHPQRLAYLSTRSGCKTFLEQLAASNEGVNVLPYSSDVYSETGLLNELTNLVYRYPFVRRWILKIDNETNSRGIAYIDVGRILGKFLLKLQGDRGPEKAAREQIFAFLQNSIVHNREERVVPLARDCYAGQSEYLAYFYTRGGVIEASINNFESDLENVCFCVDLQPDGEWKFVSSHYKITNQHRTIGAYYDASLIKPLMEVEQAVAKLKRDGYFGYFTFEFISINQQFEKSMKKFENKVHYLNAVECRLDPFSAATYLRQLISKDSNTLFIPFLQHPVIRDLRMQTFFHLCRLQNISFDIEKRIGNVFTFMDGLESSCLGIMTFNDQSREDCYAHTAEVLDFLSSKLKQSTSSKDIPASFFAIKSAVNGYLNRSRKMKLRTEKSIAHA